MIRRADHGAGAHIGKVQNRVTLHHIMMIYPLCVCVCVFLLGFVLYGMNCTINRSEDYVLMDAATTLLEKLCSFPNMILKIGSLPDVHHKTG